MIAETATVDRRPAPGPRSGLALGLALILAVILARSAGAVPPARPGAGPVPAASAPSGPVPRASGPAVAGRALRTARDPVGGGAHTFLSTPGMDLDVALQRVAHRLFSPKPGRLLTIAHAYDHPLLHHAVYFSKYKVSDQGTELGSFLRMRVLHGATTSLDVALIAKEGRVAAVEPLRPVVLDGAPMLDFKQILGVLGKYPARDYARPLHRLFHALSGLERAASPKPEKTFTREQVEALVTQIKAHRPARSPGSPVPDFQTVDETGAAFGPDRIRGAPTLVVTVAPLFASGRRFCDWMARFASENPGRYRIFTVVVNRMPVITEYRRRGGVFAGVVVPDPELVVYKAFRIGLSPCVHVFGADGRLVRQIDPPHTTYEDLAAALRAP